MSEWQRTLGRSELPVDRDRARARRARPPGYLTLGHGEDLGGTARSGGDGAPRARGARRRLRRGRALLRRRALLRPRRGVPGVVAATRGRRGRRSARNGATRTRPTGRSTPTRPRSRTSRPARSAARSPRRESCSATGWGCTRSTRPRSRAACSRTRSCWTGFAELRGQGVAIGLTATGADQAATIEQPLRPARSTPCRRRSTCSSRRPAGARARARAPGWA